MLSRTSPQPSFEKLSWQELERRKQRENLFLIDLRSEKEFEKGHVPGAYNLPLLSNDERKIVGTLYKEEGKNKATVKGFQFFQNKSQTFLAEIERLMTPLRPHGKLVLYCARGGMRSRITAGFLASLGYPTLQIEGGYKFYRRHVLEGLKALNTHPLLVLHGHTGAGKTELIQELRKPQYDIGVLDFEGLAHHSGSAFGDLNQEKEKATQSQFENNLYEAYQGVKHHERLLVEIESTLGQAKLSPELRRSLTSSPMILLKRNRRERARALFEGYTSPQTKEKINIIQERMELLRDKFSKALFHELLELLEGGKLEELIDILLKEHYDPRYEKSLNRYKERMIAQFSYSSQKKEAIHFIKSYVQGKISDTLLRA